MSAHVMVRVLFLQRAQLSVGRTWTHKCEPRKINVKSSTELRQFFEEEENVPHKLNSSVSSSLLSFLVGVQLIGARDLAPGEVLMRGSQEEDFIYLRPHCFKSGTREK